jgi:hypothetical protein
MNLASRLRVSKLRALAGLATVSLASACTYDFDQFEGLAPPIVDDAGQGGRGGSGGADAGKDGSVDGGGQGGATNTGGSGQGGSGGSTGGSGGTTGGSGGSGATGGSGGTGATGGTGGSSTGGSGGSGNGGSGGTTSTGGSGGATSDASTDGSGGKGGATGGSGGATGGTGGTGGATGGTGGTSGTGGTTGGTGGTTGGTAGNGGTPPADASDVIHPPDVQPDNRIVDVAPDTRFDCSSVGGTTYQGHCYYARSVAVDWNTAATTTCEAPAHLVTITSAGEQNVVESLLPSQDRWIGLRRPTNSPKAESSFYWVTNETLSYRNWDVYSDADKEPNYTGECVRMRFTSMWADVACTEALAVICEHD